jgi:hypothetical protein
MTRKANTGMLEDFEFSFRGIVFFSKVCPSCQLLHLQWDGLVYKQQQ